MGFTSRNMFTIACGSAGLLVWASSIMWDLHPLYGMEMFLHRANRLGSMDELLFGLVLMGAGRAIDIGLRYAASRKRLEVKRERLNAMHATVRTIEDSVLNTYNGVHLLISEARDRGVSEEIIGQIEQGIRKSTAEIRALNKMDEASQKENSSGMNYIDIRVGD